MTAYESKAATIERSTHAYAETDTIAEVALDGLGRRLLDLPDSDVGKYSRCLGVTNSGSRTV